VTDMRGILDALDRRPPATDAAIAESEKHSGTKLPAEYVEFLRLANGGAGFVGKNTYVMLWGVEELAPMNQSYEVQKYAPGLLIFGSDGGGEAYGFDTRTAQPPVVQMPFVGMAWSVARFMGGTFSVFLERLREAK
jgi:hypothetical protein